MQTKHFVWISLTAMSLVACTSAALAGANDRHDETASEATLVETVRRATERFQNAQEALDAGYTAQQVCVSGPEEGAMGVHFVNPELFGDGQLDPSHPELLVYEPKHGQLRLVAVEYVVDAATWDRNHPTMTPSLLGQLFHYNGSPNRYGSPPFYELHVWAWKQNPNGMFTDWNPKVSCEDYVP
jgi:hypothetical protein